MKDGRTHLAHKAEHAVDLETGAIVAVTLQGADQGDTTTIVETVSAATAQVDAAQTGVDEPQSLDEIIADKGYHSNQTLVDLKAVGIRTYIAEPDRGRRIWSKMPEAQAPVYGNRRRIRGPRGRRLMRQRGEKIERSFAHVRHRRDAAHAPAGAHEYLEAPAASCRCLQSRTRDAARTRRRDAARPARPRERGRRRPYRPVVAHDAYLDRHGGMPERLITIVHARASTRTVTRLRVKSALSPRAARARVQYV